VRTTQSRRLHLPLPHSRPQSRKTSVSPVEKTTLHHIAIIPDGNRRWAKKKGKPLFFGHREGAKAIEKILKTGLDLNIRNMTIWGTSLANVTERSREEVQFLFALFGRYFKKLASSREVHKHKVRVEILGRWEELFPERVKKHMRRAVEKTKRYNDYHLTFLMAYSGLDEMLDTVQRLAESARKQPKLTIDEKVLKAHLWTKDLPPVDLVIRTGDEPHWSQGMMMWDVAEARLYFTKTLWPAFSPQEFKKALDIYSNTERRFGK